MPEAQSWQGIADTLGFKSEKEMLENFYVMQNFSLSQLAQILGYSTWSIRRRLLMNQIPLRKKGGALNRLGRRRLKHLTDQDLETNSAARLALKYNTHISTVYAEIRLRAGEKQKEKDKQYELLSNNAGKSVRDIFKSGPPSHGSGSVSGE